MTEPQDVGFTGKVWDAIPADQLVRELTTGPGAEPMAAAAVAYGQVAAGLGEAAVEYRAVLAALGNAWPSKTGDLVVARLTGLQQWLDDATESAAATAVHAATQAAAYEAAALAMPTAAAAAVIQAAKNALTYGNPLGGPLVGVAATLEDDADGVTKAAAEVMRQYELATAPLSRPWPQQNPPDLTAAAALTAEQAAASGAAGAGTSMPAMKVPVVPVAPNLVAPPLMPTAYRAEPTLAQESMRADEVTQEVATQVPTSVPAATPVAPAGAIPQSADATVDSYRPVARAADIGDLDRIGLATSADAVPAVLGGAAPSRMVVTGEPT